MLKADCLLIGLQLQSNMKHDYTIYFEWLSLWDKSSLGRHPDVVRQLIRSKSAGCVYFNSHTKIYPFMVEQVKVEFGNLLKSEINLSEFLAYWRKIYNHTISNIVSTPKISICSTLFETILALSIYLGEKWFENMVRDFIDREVPYWNERDCKVLFNVSPNEWKADLYKRFEDREAFMDEIKRNSELPKVARLNTAMIVNDLTPDSPCLRSYQGLLGPHRRYWPWYVRLWDWLKTSLSGRK